ncbi:MULTISPECIES: hypothetical protein [Methylobacterium]|jgi:hypothetical protein|uniref:hypothetical protein n=1 Tax=Methylobacterium TaxID=407 RepID=UPI001043DFEE|nr:MULTISPECIES: hypothetical protein [Methylobacterium]MDR7036754.1 hypothetical protein [Methylobacterium sp. BE186]
MINASLQDFCNRIAAAGRMTAADLRILGGELLPDGLTTRDEADLLIALDRALGGSVPAFADFLVASLVDFAVWGERPTGYVNAETARWLAASIGNGRGPTTTGARIAVEIVREAQASDETLVAFALAANRCTLESAPAENRRAA